MNGFQLPLQYQSPQFGSQVPQGAFSVAPQQYPPMQGAGGFQLPINTQGTNPLSVANQPTASGSLFDTMKGWNWAGNKESTGILSPAIQGLSSAANAWLGMQGLDLAKEQLGFQKEAFNKNFESQSTLTNSQLEDRQRARYASNKSAYESPDEYMKKNRVGK